MSFALRFLLSFKITLLPIPPLAVTLVVTLTPLLPISHSTNAFRNLEVAQLRLYSSSSAPKPENYESRSNLAHCTLG